MTELKRFNLRVYGIILNDKGEVLLSTESRKGMRFTKFPGGGLQWGEGIIDCLQREMMEELGSEMQIKELFYLTEHFQLSAFSKEEQLISTYYLLGLPDGVEIPEGMESLDPEEPDNHFYWHKVEDIAIEELTFPIDREVIKSLKNKK
ncbi:MAG: NUDIX hydrolase [Flavobacteriales bacterium]|nr:NUDIX hydrolase [Flavobacteriales bacterium]